MKRFDVIPRVLASFLALGFVLPEGSAHGLLKGAPISRRSTLRVSQENTGLEELRRTLLPAAGLEEVLKAGPNGIWGQKQVDILKEWARKKRRLSVRLNAIGSDGSSALPVWGLEYTGVTLTGVLDDPLSKTVIYIQGGNIPIRPYELLPLPLSGIEQISAEPGSFSPASWPPTPPPAAGMEEEADAFLNRLRWQIDLGFQSLEDGHWEPLAKLLDDAESAAKQIPPSWKDHEKIRIALLFLDYLRMKWRWHRITSGDSPSADSYEADLHAVLQLSDQILKGDLPDIVKKEAAGHRLAAFGRLIASDLSSDLSAFEQIATDPLLPKVRSFTALSWAHLKRSSYFQYRLGIPETALIHLRYALAYGLMAIVVPPDPSLKASEQEELLSDGRMIFRSILLWPIPDERLGEFLNELPGEDIRDLHPPEDRIQPALRDVLSHIEFSSKDAAEGLTDDLRKPDWRAVLEISSIAAQVLAEILKRRALEEPDYEDRLNLLRWGKLIAERLPEGPDLLLTEGNFREFSKSWYEELKEHPGFSDYPLGRLIYKPEQAAGMEEARLPVSPVVGQLLGNLGEINAGAEEAETQQLQSSDAHARLA